MKLQITIDGKAYVVDVELLEEEEAPPEERAPLPPPIPPPAPVVPSQNYPAPAASDSKVCHSPVMGVVNKVNVEPGKIVEPGEVILVLESMKMETQVTAPNMATVKSVFVKQGDPVKLNQPLVEFE